MPIVRARFFRMIVAAAMLTCAIDAVAGQTMPPQTTPSPATDKKTSYPEIVIYTVTWCPHCQELKNYLTSRGIPFSNRDVEVDAAAMEELTTRYKSQGVPVVVFGQDQEVLKGFTPESFETTAAKALAHEKKP